VKLCLNGHEWAKRQLEKRKIAYEALDNGFLSCADPEKLQHIVSVRESPGPAKARSGRSGLEFISAGRVPTCGAVALRCG
jgi:hypothetical protein